MDKIICIYNTLNSTEADLIKALLESAGIPCYLRSDNAGGTLPYLTLVNGIGIMVNQEDKDQATKIIHDQLTHSKKDQE